MEISTEKLARLCSLPNEEFTIVLKKIAISSGADQRTVEKLCQNSPKIQNMLKNCSKSDLESIVSLLSGRKKLL